MFILTYILIKDCVQSNRIDSVSSKEKQSRLTYHAFCQDTQQERAKDKRQETWRALDFGQVAR
jgi:hypothetical protein